MLKPRTTWINGISNRVHVVGPAVGHPEIFYSVEGDWYRKSDGAIRLCGEGVLAPWFPKDEYGSYILDLVREDTSQEAEEWWVGVPSR